jgi:hypothetical protein
MGHQNEPRYFRENRAKPIDRPHISSSAACCFARMVDLLQRLSLRFQVGLCIAVGRIEVSVT